MEASRPWPVAPIVFGLVVAVIAVWITVAVVNDRDPEETVEEYLTALVDKDVEGALALVTRYGYGVPYGENAAFLTAEAISDDWWVVSVEETGREYDSSARVKAVIGHPGGTAAGEFEVQEVDDEWFLEDPFARVRFPRSPLAYVKVNDEVVPRSPDTDDNVTYALFPGTYDFYRSVRDVVSTGRTEAVAVFPPGESRTDTLVVPRGLTPAKRVVANAQEAVEQRIDECARFATPAPYGNCPFATDGEIDTRDGRRVNHLHGLKWTVERYPVVAMTDDRSTQYAPGFAVRAVEPGAVTLSGSGRDTDDKQVTFTVTCDVDLTGLTTTVRPDGGVDLSEVYSGRTGTYRTFDTCRRSA